MSSATVAAAIGLQQNDYLTVALLTLFVYDYVLTLPREIDYIWNKRWTMVSTLFLLVRYCGLYILITLTLMWSSFLPGPVETYVFNLHHQKFHTTEIHPTVVSESFNISHVHPVQGRFQGEALYLAAIWAFVVWIGSADLVMILRVWAMYSRSRLILGILLAFWVLEIIPSIITCIMYPNKISVAVTQVLNLAYCGVTSSSVTWTKVSAIPEIVNGGVMCILVIYQFAKRVLEIYKVTKKLHFNRYMNLLAGQSILYFLFIFFFNRTAILIAMGQFQTEGWPTLVLLPLEYVPAFALTPRFILSIRALHPSEPQGSQGHEVDVGFGLSGSRHRDRDHDTTIVMDIRRPKSDEIEPDADIPMEEWRITMEPGSGVV